MQFVSSPNLMINRPAFCFECPYQTKGLVSTTNTPNNLTSTSHYICDSYTLTLFIKVGNVQFFH